MFHDWSLLLKQLGKNDFFGSYTPRTQRPTFGRLIKWKGLVLNGVGIQSRFFWWVTVVCDFDRRY